jgi:hypothetical protein
MFDPKRVETLYYLLGCIAIIFVPFKYIWKWFRNVDKAVTNDIPHVYAILKRMCEHLGIEYIDLEEDLQKKK